MGLPWPPVLRHRFFLPKYNCGDKTLSQLPPVMIAIEVVANCCLQLRGDAFIFSFVRNVFERKQAEETLDGTLQLLKQTG
jgi:hypothetical protein